MALRVAATTALRTNSRCLSTSALDRMQSVESYNKVLQKFAEDRACAVLRTATSDACPKAMQAAIDGGFTIGEFTLTTPNCLNHLADFRKKYFHHFYGPNLIKIIFKVFNLPGQQVFQSRYH